MNGFALAAGPAVGIIILTLYWARMTASAVLTASSPYNYFFFFPFTKATIQLSLLACLSHWRPVLCYPSCGRFTRPIS